MVGAGFSLNAKARPGAKSAFPTWQQLVRAMFDELYPPISSDSPAILRAREGRFTAENPLKIASEYEAAFGKRKLDLLVRSQIPDSDYEPGELSRLLLQLPWTDVFTTNYDTLLERTEIDGRAYQAVTNVSELTVASSPRIIKLHGSLPSGTPLIISEEDYRTYPRQFAPFVNSVRQSLIENAFVLIGFSGNDPNFLAWTGWIRDELGTGHAPIYLVVSMALGNGERLLLERRGITPIDLSSLFAGSGRPGGIHADSLEWFLRCLGAAQPPSKDMWPTLSRAVVAPAHLPPLVGRSPVPAQVDLGPGKPPISEVVITLMERWERERREYPGWLVAPHEKCAALWIRTMYWIAPLIDFLKTSSSEDRLLAFREINWRLETCMAPSLGNVIGPFAQSLDEIFPRLMDGSTAPTSSLLFPSQPISILKLAEGWLEIAFAVLRDTRENYDAARWNALKTKIDQIVSRYSKQSDRPNYEAALWDIWNTKRLSARETLSRWQVSSNSPLAVMQKASLLAEIGEVGEARTLLRFALSQIRRALGSQGQNIELLSCEGWCTYVLALVEMSLDIGGMSSIREEFEERWLQLKAWDCDPRQYLSHFEDALAASPPEPKVDQRVRGFDPGIATKSVTFANDIVTPLLPAFGCIRMFERAGVPMHLRMVAIAGTLIKNACRWIAPYSGFWSPALLVRAGRSDDLVKGSFVTRTGVAVMEPALAGRVYRWCLEAFKEELRLLDSHVQPGSSQESVLEALSKVLSRLAFKVGKSERDETFPFVLFFYRQQAVRCNLKLHDACDPWFHRLFDSADVESLIEWLPDLIKVPLWEPCLPSGFPEQRASPDPMRTFPTPLLRKMEKVSDQAMRAIRSATDWLLNRTSAESGEGRRRALSRLIVLYGSTIMTDDQKKRFGELLWSLRDSSGLPDLPGYHALAFLYLPKPEKVNAASAVKAYILGLARKVPARTDSAQSGTIIRVGTGERSFIVEGAVASKPAIELPDEDHGKIEWDAGRDAKAISQRERSVGRC